MAGLVATYFSSDGRFQATGRAGVSVVWEISSYQDFLSENAGRRHVIGSALVMLAAVSLLLIVFA